MSNSLKFEGLNELRAALRRLPSELVSEASHVVLVASEEAAQDMRAGYQAHRQSGDLGSKVRVTHEHSAFGASARVTNTSKHALPFEYGTQVRRTRTGANRGSMPPGNVFAPIVARKRRQMLDQLKAMVVKLGLLVSGDA